MAIVLLFVALAAGIAAFVRGNLLVARLKKEGEAAASRLRKALAAAHEPDRPPVRREDVELVLRSAVVCRACGVPAIRRPRSRRAMVAFGSIGVLGLAAVVVGLWACFRRQIWRQWCVVGFLAGIANVLALQVAESAGRRPRRCGRCGANAALGALTPEGRSTIADWADYRGPELSISECGFDLQKLLQILDDAG